MIDREKVIKGLEHCKEGNSCDGCPYDIGSSKCIFLSHDDILALLKEQKDVVLCKYCKWYDERISMCDNCGLPREQTFFCADGIRKDS